ncbi:MAG: DUF4956 domain-containing protein [Bacteroidetes bacterium]|nr:DUF4956 domain-containing protein [Bacteroidota bacterium]MBU1717980.1 DUF4956 domain-containing protein [Bacteroidota bacterium]
MILQLLADNALGSFMGMEMFDRSDFLELLVRFAFNALVLLVLVRFIYYKISGRKDYLFTLYLLGIMVFLICFLLSNVKLQLGFALGLFAIFGILRYRTFQVPIREMTYLFTVIGLSVINSLVNKKISIAELLFTNFAVLTIIFVLERVAALKLTHESSKRIIYEKINLIVPEKRAELIADLEKRTGLKIHRLEIGRINFLQDTARIQIFYYEQNPNSADDADLMVDSDNDD